MRRPGSFFVVALVALASAGTRARAELRCDEPLVTLGEVKAGQRLNHRFTFTNVGTEVAEITTVQPSCGCLKPRLEERRLRPGDAGVLVLEVNTLTTPAGPNAWRVQVLYTCGGQPLDLTLTLRATVVAEIAVHPAALVLQTETSVGSEVTLTDARAKPLAVTGARATDPLLRASVREARRDEAGRVVQAVRLEVGSGFPDGRHDETLQIYTSDPEYPELRVPVTVVKYVHSAVRATPAEVTLTATGGPLPARVVLLRGGEDEEVEVERAECDDPAVRCTWAKGPGKLATLRVRVDHTKVGTEGLHAEVRVHFHRPAGASLAVPVHSLPR
jgi:hypothetical protein